MRERLENFWYYYKWYVLGALLVLVLALNFISQKKNEVRPDLQIGLVTMAEVSGEQLDALGEMFSAALADGGSAAPLVQVNYYPYDADAMNAADTAQFMAASVQLAADLRQSVSFMYITDTPELLEDADVRLHRAGVLSGVAGAEFLDGFTVLCRDDAQADADKILN